MKKWIAWFLSAVTVIFLLTACGSKTASVATSSTSSNGTTAAQDAAGKPKASEAPVAGDSLSVALLLTGSVNDPGWNNLAYEGLKEVGTSYGCEISFLDRLNGDTLPDAVTRSASDGKKVIIGVGQSFSDAALKIGKKYPDTRFICIQGSSSASNLASYNIKTEEAAYLTGMLASGLSISNKIGYIGAFNEEPYAKAARAFENGARETNPDITFQAVWLDSSTDIGLAREAANDMISSGADLVGQSVGQSSTGVLDAVDSGDIMTFGEVYDQSKDYSRNVVTSALYNVSRLVDLAVQDVINGSFTGGIREFGFADSVIELAPYNLMDSRVPKKLKISILEKIDAMKAGTFVVPCEAPEKK